MPDANCPLCGGKTAILHTGANGYQAGAEFDIVRCATCDTHFCAPMAVDDSLYENIYRNAEILPGYERYFNYARRVLRSQDPLALLAASEDVYWFAADYLAHCVSKDSPILEVGSGLGYLTYAIHRAGYDIKGVDISTEAVAAANARYGDLFFSDDIFRLADSGERKYKVIILTEVIEHIPDPVGFVQALKACLVDGGVLLMTTPNKSSAPANLIWQGDAPPVHLWWFSESSARQLAARADMDVKFWDFAAYNGSPEVSTSNAPLVEPTFETILDAAGTPLVTHERDGAASRVEMVRRVAGEDTALAIRKRLLGPGIVRSGAAKRSHLSVSRSDAMAMVFTKR